MISTLQLQYFRALAHKQNLTKCAEDFYISQSTLSNSLTRMEADLGVQLFDRRGRSLSLNKYGEVFLEYVEVALKAIEDGKQALTNEFEEQRNKAIVYTISPLIFSKILDRYAGEYPEFNVIQREFLYSDISMIDSLDPNMSLIIAGTGDIKSPSWDHCEFREDTLCALLNINHPLASRESIDYSLLNTYPLILEETRTSFRAFLDTTFKEYNINPKVANESNYSLLAVALKRRPDAVGITTTITRDNGCYKWANYLSQIPITGMPLRGFSIYWRKGFVLSDAATELIDYIKTTRGVSKQ